MICAVAVVNCIVILFARRAFYDEINEQQSDRNSDKQETKDIDKKSD